MATVDTVGVKYEGDTANLRKQLEQLIAENKRLLGQVDRLGDEYAQTGNQGATAIRQVDTQTSKLKGSTSQLGGIVSKIGPAMVAAFSITAIAAFAKQVLDVSANFQKMEAVLTNTLGSKGAAQAAMKEIVAFASKTPFAVDELTNSFVKLANQGFIPTQEEMRKLGDLASSQGKSFDMLTEAIIDAQTGEFERLKEFGIRAQKEGDNVKFSFKGVETQTKFNSEAMREYILSLGDLEGVSGGMAAISETLGGKFSNLGDATMALQKELGDKLNPIMIDLIDITLEIMDNMDVLAAPLEEVGALFGDMFQSIAELVNEMSGLTGEGADTAAMMEVLAKGVRIAQIPIKIIIGTVRLAVDTFRLLVNEAKKAANFFGAEFEIDLGLSPESILEDAKRIAGAFDLARQSAEGGIVAEGFFSNQVALNEARLKKELEAKQREAKKLAEEKKKEAEKQAAIALKQEFDAQAIRIDLMDEGLGKELAKRQLAYMKEQQQFKDNKEALLLIEQRFLEDIAKLEEDALLAELDRQHKQQEKDQKFTEDFEKAQFDELQAEIEKQERKTEIDKKAEDDRLATAQKVTDDRVAMEESSFAAISAIGNALIADEMKRAQFQKAVSLFQIGVATAEAIAKGVASAQSVPFPGNLIAIAATVATVFANIATAKSILSSAPTPAFKEGVIDLQGPGTETSDSIHARLSKRESVMTAQETKKYKEELLAMRAGNFEDLMLQKYVMPALQRDKQSTASNMANSFMLNHLFDDSRIVGTLEKNKPATAKDIKGLGRDISKGLEKAAYKQSKLWRNG